MSKEEKAMTKREIVKEISDVTNLKTEVVMSVINAFIAIFIRETVLKGNFRLANCFTVKTHDRKARKQYNVNKGEEFEYPATKMLGITLSRKIHSFHRWKMRHKYNEEHGLEPSDWGKRSGPELPESTKGQQPTE